MNLWGFFVTEGMRFLDTMHSCSEKYFLLQGFFFYIVIDLVKGRAKMALITSSFEKFIQYLTRLSEIKCCEST